MTVTIEAPSGGCCCPAGDVCEEWREASGYYADEGRVDFEEGKEDALLGVFQEGRSLDYDHGHDSAMAERWANRLLRGRVS